MFNKLCVCWPGKISEHFYFISINCSPRTQFNYDARYVRWWLICAAHLTFNKVDINFTHRKIVALQRYAAHFLPVIL